MGERDVELQLREFDSLCLYLGGLQMGIVLFQRVNGLCL